jgi:hypothetical protein
MDALIQQNSLLISLLAGNLVQRPVRNGLHHQARSRVSATRLFRSWALRAAFAFWKRRLLGAVGFGALAVLTVPGPAWGQVSETLPEEPTYAWKFRRKINMDVQAFCAKSLIFYFFCEMGPRYSPQPRR